MQQESVRDSPQLFDSRLIVFQNRRIGKVCTGHDQHIKSAVKEKHMQGRIRQHHAQPVVFAEVRKLRAGIRLFLQQNNRLSGSIQDARFVLRNPAEAPCGFQIAAHDSEGLLIPLLASAKFPRNGRVVAAAGQMETAEALDGNDLPFPQRLLGKRNRVAGYRIAVGIQKAQRRPADRTAVRLGMIASVFNVVILAVAVRAHGKSFHGGLRPVIGHILDDGQPRAAVCAVDEGIAVTPVLRVQQFPQAVRADGDVRGNKRVAFSLALALNNGKVRKTPRRNPAPGNVFDDC